MNQGPSVDCDVLQRSGGGAAAADTACCNGASPLLIAIANHAMHNLETTSIAATMVRHSPPA
jgi:hypothetical protein